MTPTYNRGRFLPTAINSVKEQTYKNIEHIVVDDASDEPASRFVDENEIVRIIRHDENQGANAARNTGIEHSNGKYIAFLDDDDEWSPTKIEQQVRRALETDAGVVYTGIQQKQDGKVYKTLIPDIEGDITKKLLIGAPLPSTSVIMVRTEVFNDVGMFDEKLPNHQDWELYIRASKIYHFAAVTEALVTRYHHTEQISDDYIGKRDVTVPEMISKHGDLAIRYNVRDEFEAMLELTLGETALRTGRFSEAHQHYRRSAILNPNVASISRTLATVFGKWSYRPAKFTREMVDRIRS
ncbi:glycosyltransferase [Salinigranum marinum]|uniref:glycosyltransferase n=1 Tax=Salinigranum marinum TaxID=1515595 RepID=UPI002989ECC5|nr:glycosyltransferase [Salinigranum marinum]